MKKTKVNLFSGFLGVGKTTLLKNLIAQKPENEKWAVIVNEFGDVGIDGAVLESQDIAVSEIVGGCFCCVAGPQLTATVAKVLRQYQPDRLLLEASGLAQVANVIDELREKPLSEALVLQAAFTLVDPRQFNSPTYYDHQTYRQQVNACDILVASKCDLASDTELQAFEEKASQLFPPKFAIIRSKAGVIDLAYLDQPLSQSGSYCPKYRLKHSDDLTWHSAGWVFSSDTQFDLQLLTQFFDEIGQKITGLERAKGVFLVEDQWAWLNWTSGYWGAAPVEWRRDSRFEVIAHEPLEVEKIYAELSACVKASK